jgi:hypothetical protein
MKTLHNICESIALIVPSFGVHFRQLGDIAILLTVLTACTVVGSLSGCATVESDWESARQVNSRSAYADFIQKHPETTRALEAKKIIEDSDWQRVRSADSIAAYKDFLTHHPKSQYVPTALQRIAEMEEAIVKQKKQEEKAFLEAARADDKEAYKEFLDRFPSGAHASEARDRFSDLEELRLHAGYWQVQVKRADIVKEVQGYRAPQGSCLLSLTLSIWFKGPDNYFPIPEVRRQWAQFHTLSSHQVTYAAPPGLLPNRGSPAFLPNIEFVLSDGKGEVYALFTTLRNALLPSTPDQNTPSFVPRIVSDGAIGVVFVPVERGVSLDQPWSISRILYVSPTESAIQLQGPPITLEGSGLIQKDPEYANGEIVRWRHEAWTTARLHAGSRLEDIWIYQIPSNTKEVRFGLKGYWSVKVEIAGN